MLARRRTAWVSVVIAGGILALCLIHDGLNQQRPASVTATSTISGRQAVYSQKADGLYQSTSVPDDPVTDSVLTHDLNLSNMQAELVGADGRYYEFAVSPQNGYGGVTLIAMKGPTGRFELIWEGQDDPPCAPLTRYDVPIPLAPYCFQGTGASTNLINRTGQQSI